MVQNCLPRTLKRASIFEDFSGKFATALTNTQLHGIWPFQTEPSRIVNPQLGATFASRSLDLEQLSMVDAEDFFQACQPAWSWENLQSLALTSQLLRATGSPREIDILLYEAGAAALRMPSLRTLVLGNGRKGIACAFIYHTDRYHASITWRGTWETKLSPRVVEVWERVALERRSCPLRVGKEQVCGDIASHGDAIHHLALPCRVVAPASLWQIRREGG